MILEESSHVGRPVAHELVPSRYALRIGEIDVLVVSDGVLSLPGAMLGHNVDPAVREAPGVRLLDLTDLRNTAVPGLSPAPPAPAAPALPKSSRKPRYAASSRSHPSFSANEPVRLCRCIVDS